MNDTSTPNIADIVVEKAVLNQLYAEHKEKVDALKASMNAGESKKALNERGLQYGSISLAKKSPTAKIDDPSIVAAQADELGIELIDTIPAPGTDGHEEVVNYLAEYAPHLLGVPEIANKEELKALADKAVETWQETGKAPLGWKVTEGGAGNLTINLTKRPKQDSGPVHEVAKKLIESWRAVPQAIEQTKEIEGTK